MNFDGLSIRRTSEGQFVLVHMDNVQKVETEKHRSTDLEEIVDRLIEGHEINHAKDNSILDYGPILAIINSLSQRYPNLDDERFPENWTEPLDLYGCICEELIRYDVDLAQERRRLAGLVFDKGPEWVWKNRVRLTAERVYSIIPDGHR
jgi:hypothetical protein